MCQSLPSEVSKPHVILWALESFFVSLAPDSSSAALLSKTVSMFLDFLGKLMQHPVPCSPTLLKSCITQKWVKDTKDFEGIKYDTSPPQPTLPTQPTKTNNKT